MFHVIYRSYGGENRKDRPAYYSKLLCLMSFIRSFRQLKMGAAETIFLNDGPIPADRLRIMEKSGEVVTLPHAGMQASMLSALAIPSERAWPNDDLVWFAEDDYLYLPHALNDLVAAAETYPDASYFGLYATIGCRQPNGLPCEDRVPRGYAEDPETTLVNGHPWRPALSTTSTFGARVKSVVEDRSMMKFAIYSSGGWDQTTCLMYQGFMPYQISFLVNYLLTPNSKNGWLQRVGIFGVRIGLDLYHAVRASQRSNRRNLVASDPALITHLEPPYLALGTDWQSVAASTQQWTNAECV